MTDFFSDRESGPIPRTLDDLPIQAWGGLVALFDRMADTHLFAQTFPEQCQDGRGVCGTSTANLWQTLRAQVPAFQDWPRPQSPPETLAAMDLVEFGWRHAATPIVRDHHSYMGHDHFAFDQAAGRTGWRQEVNLILRRNGVRLELGSDGKVTRVDPPAAQFVLEQLLPSSGNDTVDFKLQVAATKYRNPDINVRKEGLEALWDAFEGIKSMLDTNKAAAVKALIGRMTPSEAWQAELDQDFRQLTNIGNQFQIRHFEQNKPPIDDEMIDHLFIRTFSLVSRSIYSITGP